MEYDNWRDNLLGISILLKTKFIEQVVYEYMYTKHQSGILIYGYMRGRDNYFNHGYYKAGLPMKDLQCHHQFFPFAL